MIAPPTFMTESRSQYCLFEGFSRASEQDPSVTTVKVCLEAQGLVKGETWASKTRTSKLLRRDGREMAQVLLHLPLRADIAEQLNDSGARRKGRAGRGGKVSPP